MFSDLHSTREAMGRGETDSRQEIEKSIAAAQSPACENVFLLPTFDAARQTAAKTAGMTAARTPLAGLAVSVKDLFDVEGQVTSAGSVVLTGGPPAARDCPPVARLRAAGAAFIGRTNMSEFAFSGVGINPHFGTPRNAADTAVHRVPGGSTSGGAVSVATGAAFVALGSDTGGSIRVPAALNGIVGFKNTARRVPTDGAVPLSTTLDTVCAMTRSVRDAITAHEILAARQVAPWVRPLSACRFAVARTWMLDDLDPVVARNFDAAVAALRNAGATVQEIALTEIAELSAIQATGGFSAAESFAWHRHLLKTQADRYDPRVRARIERGAGMSAADYVDLVQARIRWIASMEAALQGFDAVLSPTVPMVAPAYDTIAPGADRDEAFFRTNTLLLRNPSVVNMLDGCAISIPCHRAGDLPAGLMLWHGAEHDDAILGIALATESLLRKR